MKIHDLFPRINFKTFCTHLLPFFFCLFSFFFVLIVFDCLPRNLSEFVRAEFYGSSSFVFLLETNYDEMTSTVPELIQTRNSPRKKITLPILYISFCPLVANFWPPIFPETQKRNRKRMNRNNVPRTFFPMNIKSRNYILQFKKFISSQNL